MISMPAAVHVEDLTVAYTRKPVLWDVDVDFPVGSLTAVAGPNGAGKSTLLKAILGFVKPVAGKVEIFGRNNESVKGEIAYVPQISTVNWDFPVSVFEVVLMGRYRQLGWFRRANSEAKERAMAALSEMDLTPLKDRHISELSGGQRQRVFIARALCQDAKLLLMDEPLAGVDKISERIIIDKLHALKSRGHTVVCVHHDLRTLPEYFERVVLINRGIVASGSVSEAFTRATIEQAYNEVIPL